MKDFTSWCQENRLDILLAVSANTLSRWIGWPMLDRFTGGWVTSRVAKSVDEILVEQVLHARLGERHGSHSMSGTSHEPIKVTQNSQPHHRTIVARRFASLSVCQSGFHSRVPFDAKSLGGF